MIPSNSKEYNALSPEIQAQIDEEVMEFAKQEFRETQNMMAMVVDNIAIYKDSVEPFQYASKLFSKCVKKYGIAFSHREYEISDSLSYDDLIKLNKEYEL